MRAKKHPFECEIVHPTIFSHKLVTAERKVQKRAIRKAEKARDALAAERARGEISDAASDAQDALWDLIQIVKGKNPYR